MLGELNTLGLHIVRGTCILCFCCSVSWLEYRLLQKKKMLSYRREIALQGGLVIDKSGRLELGDNILRTL